MSLPAVTCPACGGELILRKNKKNGNQFYGCSSFPACLKVFTLREHRVLTYRERGV